MTLTIELTPEQESRLNAQARLQGLEPAEFAKKLVTESLFPLLPSQEQARREKIMEELVTETERLGLYR